MGAFFYLKFKHLFECTHRLSMQFMAAPVFDFFSVSNIALI